MSRRLEKSLRDSLRQMPRADLSIIINTDISKLEQHDYITRQEINPGGGIARFLITAAVSVIIVVSMSVWFLQRNMVYTMVTLDISAGFIITADKKGEILNVRGVDEASRIVLRNIDYTGASLNEIIGAIVSISAERQYLSEESNYILVSVWDRDQERSRKLLSTISQQVNISARALQIDPIVLGQYLDRSGSLEQNAEFLGITAGRLQLIDFLMKYKPAYTTEQLVRYNLESLLKIARAADIVLPISGYGAVDVQPDAERSLAQNDLLRATPKPVEEEHSVVEIHKMETAAPETAAAPEPRENPPENPNTSIPATAEPIIEPPPVQASENIPEPEPEPAPEPLSSETPEIVSETAEGLWAKIADEYEAVGNRQLDFWRGNPDSQNQIDSEFDTLQEKAAELGDEYKLLGIQYREYYQSQYELIMNEREYN